MSLSQRLAEHVARTRFEDVPDVAIEAAKRSLLDAIGVSLGASGLEPACAVFIEQALAVQGKRESTILGWNEKAPASLAALANGALGHALDFEDAYDGAPLHPNAALIPAVLALAEARGPVSGRDLLTAIAVGCDLACRLALCVRTPAESLGWYPPPIFGAYAAVAGAGRLLQLDAARMLDAFSLTLCQATCSGEIKNSPYSVLRAVREAFPAQIGVVSAQLAERGVRGFDLPFEGEFGFFRLFVAGDYDPDVLTDRLGSYFFGAEVSFKPWPSCRGTHAFIEAAQALRAAHKFTPDDIEQIEMWGGALQQMLVRPIESKRAPRTAIDAKFSLPFVVATALLRDDVTLKDFAASALQDRAVLALAKKAEHHVIADWGPKRGASGRLVLRLGDGRTLEREVLEPLGSPSNPLAWERLVQKAVTCAAHARTPVFEGAMRGFARAVETLECAADVGAVLLRSLS